jgi:hypothetical protein
MKLPNNREGGSYGTDNVYPPRLTESNVFSLWFRISISCPVDKKKLAISVNEIKEHELFQNSNDINYIVVNWPQLAGPLFG